MTAEEFLVERYLKLENQIEEKDKQISELQATIDVQDKVISELNDMFHLIKRYGAIQITDNNGIIYTEDEKILFTKLCQKLGIKPDILQKLLEEQNG